MLNAAIENRHAILERGFAEAILSDDAPIPATIQLASGPATTSRFGVYRNNVLFSLINALAARYPVTRELLWPDTFEGAARLFVAMHPPRSPLMFAYGDDFPKFLRSIGIGPSTEYVADVAELESARVRAYHSADAAPLTAEAFRSLSPQQLLTTRFELHPSISLVRSRFPIVSTWEAGRTGGDVSLWRPEAALVVRAHLEVKVWRLPPGGYDFFRKLMEGRAIAEAAEDGEIDLTEIFRILIGAGAVTAMRRELRYCS